MAGCECENCPWKKRDPKKLDTLISKFIKDIADIKALIQTMNKAQQRLDERVTDALYEFRGGGQRRQEFDPIIDDIPF